MLPFYSDASQRYLFYARRYDLDLRLIPVRGGHGINVVLSEDREIRDIAGDTKKRQDARAEMTWKQAVRQTFFEESARLSVSDRDVYYAGCGLADGVPFGL